jgi:hypothetical protein
MWDERDNDDGYYREQMNRDRAHRVYNGHCSTPYCPGSTKQRCEVCGAMNASCPCGCCNEVCECAEF